MHATRRPQRSLAEVGLQRKLASAPDCEVSAVSVDLAESKGPTVHERGQGDLRVWA